MNFSYLGERGADLVDYQSEPQKAVILIMSYDSYTIIMEPGELADFVQGHKLLTNSDTKIVTLNDEDCYIAPEGECFHIFLPVEVRTSMVREGNTFRTVRIITKAPSYRSDNA